MQVIIVGGGIAGLSAALSLHQIGVPCRIYESVPRLAPIGHGINLQPNAVRELTALGLGEKLADVGILTAELAFYNKHGQRVWTEPRGKAAGYRWPQISISRGKLHEVLLAAIDERLGSASDRNRPSPRQPGAAGRQGGCALHRSRRAAGGRGGRRPADRSRRHPLRRAQALLSGRSGRLRRLSALPRHRRRRSVPHRALDGGRRPSHPSGDRLSHCVAVGRQGDDQLASPIPRYRAARRRSRARDTVADKALGGRALRGLDPIPR